MTFVEALLVKGVRYRQGVSDHNKIHINCPFCVDTQFRLCVHVQAGWGRCMHCDWKHRWAVAPVLKQLGMLADGVYLGDQSELEALRAEAENELPADFQGLARVYDDLDRQAQRYILKRGITLEQIRHHKIGVSYSGRYAYRIIFPLYADGKLRGFNARDFTGQQQPKYLLSRGEKYIYNFDPGATSVILSEGVIKALRIEQVANQACSASLLGRSLTDNQLKQVQESSCRQVILYPDPDSSAGQRPGRYPRSQPGMLGAVEIADKLKEHWRGSVSVVFPKQPADDAPLPEILYALRHRNKPYTDLTRQDLLLA